jgi:hypothetical protein
MSLIHSREHSERSAGVSDKFVRSRFECRAAAARQGESYGGDE